MTEWNSYGQIEKSFNSISTAGRSNRVSSISPETIAALSNLAAALTKFRGTIIYFSPLPSGDRLPASRAQRSPEGVVVLLAVGPPVDLEEVPPGEGLPAGLLRADEAPRVPLGVEDGDVVPVGDGIPASGAARGEPI